MGLIRSSEREGRVGYLGLSPSVVVNVLLER